MEVVTYSCSHCLALRPHDVGPPIAIMAVAPIWVLGRALEDVSVITDVEHLNLAEAKLSSDIS